MAEIIGDAPCPKCVEAGGDKTGNHLILFADGGAYCNRCEHTENEGTFPEPNPHFGKELSPEEIQNELAEVVEESVIQAIPDRGISENSCSHFGIRVSLSEQDGVTQTAVFFPVTKGLEDSGYKVRYPNKQFGTKGDRKAGDFFGAKQCPKTGNKIFITEGEYDAAALYDTIYDTCDPKWRKQIAVVSLLNGSKSADKEIIRNRDLIEGFKEVVLVFDQDKAGREAVEKVVKVLGREKVKSVKLTEKDANEMVKQGKKRELYFACITEKAIPRPAY